MKYQSCRLVLDQLGINPFKILIVMNKIDLLSREEIEQRAQMFAGMPALGISAKTGDGTRKLRVKIVQRLFEGEDISEQNESVSEQGVFKTLSSSNV